MQDKILEVDNLKIQFQSFDRRTFKETKIVAVNGIHFTLYKGETVGIVGESGSGKSVTALSLMRLLEEPPSELVSGSILFYPEGGSKPVDFAQLRPDEDMPPYRGKHLAMIFQEPMTSLNPVYTCGAQVAEAILIHNAISKAAAKQKTIELFEKVKLPNPAQMYDRYPHELSGGQKQRVMIAMAMSCDPAILIADEPTTALDVTVQKEILKLTNELQQNFGTSILFITHDLGVIAEIADRVLVMYKGNIVESGNVEEVFLRPQHPYTKGLLACRPPLGQRLKRLPVVSDFMGERVNAITGAKELYEKEQPNIVFNNTISDAEALTKSSKLLENAPMMVVKNLNTWFPTKKNLWGKPIEWFKAVNDVSFNVYEGETLGLVGESGCGKTTLGRTILRLMRPQSGEIIFENQHLEHLEQDALRPLRKKMQIVFQDPYSSLNPRMTIGAAILEPMQVHKIYENDKIRKEKVIELLETVSMTAEQYHRYPHEFSGGQRQRICIARALALQPTFLVCDESVSALDVSVQAQVLNLLMDLKAKMKFTCVFISHDLSVVRFISDRIMVMNKGRIEEIGFADAIYQNPQTEYTQRLIEAIPKGIITK
jgi:peptide/nickel transport system ATP-binding protein